MLTLLATLKRVSASVVVCGAVRGFSPQTEVAAQYFLPPTNALQYVIKVCASPADFTLKLLKCFDLTFKNLT